MKVCTTCGKQWDTDDTWCRLDGGALSLVTEVSEVRVEGQRGSGPSPAVALQAMPTPEPAPNDDLVLGTRVGEYVIERKIGVGGMGVVYGARHPLIGKRAAIKVLSSRLSSDREAVSRFVVEAQSVNQIGHANIVDIFAFGTLDDGRSYFAMEWLQGETLGERLERGRLPVREAISIVSTLSRALEAAHAAGVIHRDLKPDNVFLATDDDGWRVKLLDFGIAKLQVAGPAISRTATGIVVGTPLFMAPEQAKGEPVDGRTDVYALGLLAYTIVCGESLFQDESSAIEVLHAHIAKPPRPPRELVPDLPIELEQLILEMVAKHPSYRPTLAEVRAKLTAIAASLGVPRPISQLSAPRLTMLSPTTSPQPSNAHGATALATPAVGTPIADPEAVAPIARSSAKWPYAVAVLAAAAVGVTIYVATHRPDDAPPLPPHHDVAVVAPAPSPVAPAPSPVAPTPSPVIATPPPSPTPPPAPPVVGTANVTIPADAQLTIDGAPVTTKAGLVTVSLPPGAHVAVATIAGHPYKRPFTITADRSVAVGIAPVQSAPSHPSGPATAVRSPPPKQPDDTDAVQNPFPK